MSSAMNLTEENFNSEVNDGGLVLVDFWAPWCGPCRMMAPVVDAVASEYFGRVKVGKVNVDEEPALAARYGVMSIPTLIMFKQGRPVWQAVGYMPISQLAKKIDLLAG